MEYREVSEIRDGMRIDWDVPVEMEDGLVLRADVYRPNEDGRFPVIMTYGPYGKWLHFEDLYSDQWLRMCAEHPDVPADSSNKYQNRAIHLTQPATRGSVERVWKRTRGH